MAIAPLDFDTIRADESNRDGPDIDRDGSGIKKWVATHFLDTASAGAGKAQIACGEKPFMTTLIPFDSKPVILTVYGVGDSLHVAIGYWPLAICCWLLAGGQGLLHK
jgi:hypothetical protein